MGSVKEKSGGEEKFGEGMRNKERRRIKRWRGEIRGSENRNWEKEREIKREGEVSGGEKRNWERE